MSGTQKAEASLSMIRTAADTKVIPARLTGEAWVWEAMDADVGASASAGVTALAPQPVGEDQVGSGVASSIIPSPGVPGPIQNLPTGMTLEDNLTIGVGQGYYGSASDLSLIHSSSTEFYSVVNNGTLWVEGVQRARGVNAINIGDITNSGRIVAISPGTEARGLSLLGTNGAVTNTGQIFAIAPEGQAVGVVDYDSRFAVTNSGLIAAQGDNPIALMRTVKSKVEIDGAYAPR